ncbi:MAG: hypothetical protein QNK04_07200 [Myxococcota bacterium]|nr:hypothetical protein [Myxococcota bacterium]
MEPTRTVALGAILLTLGGVGCRSPVPRITLPIDALRVGMKPETVHDLVGETAREEPGAWVYEDEVTNPWLVALAVPLTPALLMMAPFVAIADAVEGTETPPLWVEKRTTTLHFEDERLARWSSAVEPYPAWQDDGSVTTWQPVFTPPTFDWPTRERPRRRGRGRRGC